MGFSVFNATRGYVLADFGGDIFTSDDGYRWQLRYTAPAETFNIFSANGLLLAASDFGYISTSTNGGLDWVSQKLDTDFGITDIAYGNGTYVAVSFSGTSRVSADGFNWNVAGLGSNTLNSVVFANSIFVAAGKAGTILTSPDGVIWSRQTSGAVGRFVKIIHDGQRFVAVSYSGEVDVSADATNWTVRAILPGGFYGLTAGNGTYIIVGNGGSIYGSADLQNWQPQISGTSSDLYGAGYDPVRSRFYALGAQGTVLTSERGTNWSPSGFARQNFQAISRGPALSLGGDAGLFATGDGINWQLPLAPTFDAITAMSFDGVVSYAVGSNGMVLVSNGGLNWSYQNKTPGLMLRGVASNPSQTVAVGDNGVILTQSSFWQPQTSGTTHGLYGVAASTNRFVAVGDACALTSIDGRQWTRTDLSPNWLLRGVVAGQNRWIAVGRSGLVALSTDAMAWSPVPSVTTNDLKAVTFGNGVFVAVGAAGEIISSEDGTNWLRRAGSTTNSLQAVAYANRTFIVAGDQGTIEQSGDESIPSLLARSGANVLRLIVTGEIGRGYRIQSSGNLLTWGDWLAYTNQTRSMIFVDSSFPNSPRKFFRAISP